MGIAHAQVRHMRRVRMDNRFALKGIRYVASAVMLCAAVAGLGSGPARAAERVVLGEEFTATW
jgi:hypothetical protein